MIRPDQASVERLKHKGNNLFAAMLMLKFAQHGACFLAQKYGGKFFPARYM